MKCQLSHLQRYSKGVPLIVFVVSLSLFIGACDGWPSGGPVIDSFFLTYDIVAVGDDQGASWTSTRATTASLKVVRDDGVIALSWEQVPGDSNGVHTISTSNLKPAEYSVTLTVSDNTRSDSRTRTMLLVGTEGAIFKFTKCVDAPKVNAWEGFVDATVPVSFGQGADDSEDFISISKYVVFNKMKWAPTNLNSWPDIRPEYHGCDGAKFMTIKKMTEGYVFAVDTWTAFPFSTGPAGNYLCTSLWSPCALDTSEISSTCFDLLFSARSFR